MNILAIIAILISLMTAQHTAAKEVNRNTDIYLLNAEVVEYQADQVTLWTDDGDEWYFYTTDPSIYKGLNTVLIIDGQNTPTDLSDDIVVDMLYCTDCEEED